VDGTINKEGSITEYCNLWVQQGEQTIKMGFYIANLGRDHIILGHPWFKAFNPTINWATNQLTGPDMCIQTAGYHTKQRSSLCNIILKPPANQVATQQLIPPQYHHHWLVFSEQAAQRFPPSRVDDHAIVLKLGAPDSLDCKIYCQTEEELKVTREFIDDSLAKGYIRESKSPYASPMFYHAKQDGKLQPIIDHRVLNSWTVRDVYPLPLISSIIDRLQGKSIFTKLDLRWGFNNIQIKEED
jgi:hypothetical protein